MSDFGWFLLAVIIAWVGRLIYQGYKESTAPPPTLIDDGTGIKVPVCPYCNTRLLSIARKSNSLLAGVFAWAFILAGLLITFAVNWLAGLLTLLVGVVISILGKSTGTFLSCPSCQVDIRQLS